MLSISVTLFQDIETFDLEDFKYNSVNMTAFRLVDLDEPKVAEVLRQMERFQPIGHAILNRTGIIQVCERALIGTTLHPSANWLHWSQKFCISLLVWMI